MRHMTATFLLGLCQLRTCSTTIGSEGTIYVGSSDGKVYAIGE
jgi:outer membrane protein assembly factor BamB